MTRQQKEYKELIRGMLSKKRFTHCCNVADMCVRLARINGADEEKACTAGLLHDIRKETDPEIMNKEVLMSGFYVDPVELGTKALWHAIASAYYCRTQLGITDEDILNSIRFHTVGRAHMSTLEKIVYLGDLVSEERDYKDVEKYRKLALENLDNAMFRAMKWSIEHTMEKGGKIPVCSLDAYNFYRQYRTKTD